MAPQLPRVQVIELFHLAFLQVLQTRLGPESYALKGGANLRYFFDSVRYSEDIDLDMVNVAETWKLAEKVDAALTAPPIELVLRSSGLSVGEVRSQKQTETTRRWKVGIQTPDETELVRTKIEFSNRNGEGGYLLDPIPERIVSPYAIRAPKVQHYTQEPATKQKVEALAYRKATQARDVFDLDLLLRRKPLEKGAVEPTLLRRAIDQGVELTYEAFEDQVLPFFEPDALDLYGTTEAWDEMKLFVIEKLEDAV